MNPLARIKAPFVAFGETARAEPVVASNLIGSVISIAVGVGVPMDEELKLGVIGLVMGTATIFGRSRVVPTATLVNGEVLPSPAGQAVVIVPAGGGEPLVVGTATEDIRIEEDTP